jgi:hypothetical protein
MLDTRLMEDFVVSNPQEISLSGFFMTLSPDASSLKRR